MDLQTKIAPSWLCLAAFALASSIPSQAAAQTRDPAAAQALFDQGRELSRQGRYSEACPKFQESNRLDPGIGTQFRLAECLEQTGQIATAWATFLDVASIARSTNQLDREKAAANRASQLEPRLPKLILNVPLASQAPGLEVQRDGVRVGATQWGVPMPADPGEHQLTVTAPGYKTFSRKLTLEEGKALAVDVPALQSEPAASSEALPVVAAASTIPPAQTSQPAPGPSAPADKGSAVDAWPLVLGGVGIVGLAVGTGFAFKAKSTNSDSKQDCDAANPNVCGPTGIELRNDALKQGNIATVAFISGGALLAAAGVVWLFESKSSKHASATTVTLRASAAVAPGNASLYLRGNF